MRWRRFLETTASGVDSYVAVTWDRDPDYPDATLKIADCDRRVHLYFNFDTKQKIKASRRKLEGLKEALAKLEEVVEQYEKA